MKIICAIRDNKSAAYPFPPFFVDHPAEATRMVKMALENQQSPVSRFPGDFCLMQIGFFDPSTGMISSNETGVPQIMIEVAALTTVQQQEGVK